MDSSPEKSVMTGEGGGDSFTSQDGEKGRCGQIAESIKAETRAASEVLLPLSSTSVNDGVSCCLKR